MFYKSFLKRLGDGVTNLYYSIPHSVKAGIVLGSVGIVVGAAVSDLSFADSVYTVDLHDGLAAGNGLSSHYSVRLEDTLSMRDAVSLEA